MAQQHLCLGTFYVSNDVLLERFMVRLPTVAQDGTLHVGWADQNPQMLQILPWYHSITICAIPPKLPTE